MGRVRGLSAAAAAAAVAAVDEWTERLGMAALGTVAIALGALASRAAAPGALFGVVILAGGVVCVLVFGLTGSFAPWLVPPVMATARATATGPSGSTVLALSTHALLWSATALGGYTWLRRRQG